MYISKIVLFGYLEALKCWKTTSVVVVCTKPYLLNGIKKVIKWFRNGSLHNTEIQSKAAYCMNKQFNYDSVEYG